MGKPVDIFKNLIGPVDKSPKLSTTKSTNIAKFSTNANPLRKVFFYNKHSLAPLTKVNEAYTHNYKAPEGILKAFEESVNISTLLLLLLCIIYI